MASRPNVKMSAAQRAKQFMPFAALKGFSEALAERERFVMPKAELSEDMEAEIDQKLQKIVRGDLVTIIFFNKDEYLSIKGTITKIDKNSKILQIADKKIRFEDILDVIKIALF